MSFPPSNQSAPSSTNPVTIEVRSSDSTDSDLIIVSIQENTFHGSTASQSEPVKYRPDSGDGGAEPMDVAMSNHGPTLGDTERLQTNALINDPLINCETTSCAAMSVDLERSSSGGGSESGGVPSRSNNFTTIMESTEHAESPSNAEGDRSSEAGSSENRGKSRKSKHPIRFSGPHKSTTSGDSNTPTISQLTTSSASSSPKLVVDFEESAPKDLTTTSQPAPLPMPPPQLQPQTQPSPVVNEQSQPPVLTVSAPQPAQTITSVANQQPQSGSNSRLRRSSTSSTNPSSLGENWRPDSAGHSGGITVNLIPQPQPQSHPHQIQVPVRFPVSGQNILANVLQQAPAPHQLSGGQFAPRPASVSRQLQQQHIAALQMQVQQQQQQQQIMLAMRQQQQIAAATSASCAPRLIAPNLVLSQTRMMASAKPAQVQVPIAPKGVLPPAFRLSLAQPQPQPPSNNNQVPVSFMTGLSPAMQHFIATTISTSSGPSFNNPQTTVFSGGGQCQTFPTQASAPQIATTSSSGPPAKTVSAAPSRPPQPAAPPQNNLAGDPAKITRLIDSLAAKLQVHMPLLSSGSGSGSGSASSSTTTTTTSSQNPIQCAICSAAFSSASQLEKHLERRSLVLRYNNSAGDDQAGSSKDQELVFYNKCALLYHFRRQKGNFNASKLTIGCYLPPLTVSSTSSTEPPSQPQQSVKPTPVVEQPAPKPAPNQPVSEPVEKKVPNEPAPAKALTVTCPECEKELPVASQKKHGPLLAMEEHFQRFEGDILICRKCDVPVTNLCQAAAHARLHRTGAAADRNKNRFVCPNCGQSPFEDMAALLVHLYGSCMAQMRFLGYRCLFCAFVSRDLANLFKHTLSTHATNASPSSDENSPSNCQVKCPNCGAQFGIPGQQEGVTIAAAILNHSISATDCQYRPLSIREICKHCGRIYHAGSTMRTHIERGHGSLVSKISKSSVPFYCALCRKNVSVTATAHVTEAHSEATLTDDQPFSWLDTFSVVDRDYLLNVTAHSSNKLCSICDNLVETQEKMLDHIATHFDRICSLCFTTFENCSTLSEHVKRGDCTSQTGCGNSGKKKSRKSSKLLNLKRNQKKKRKSVAMLSFSGENEQIVGPVSALFYGYACFHCSNKDDRQRASVFEDMDALEVHIRTVHRDQDQDSGKKDATASSSTTSVNEGTPSKRSSSSVFGGGSASKAAKRSRQSDALTPFVCFACNHVAMSFGSLEAHERKCPRYLQLHGDRLSPPPVRSSTAASSSPVPQSGTSSALSSVLHNEHSQQSNGTGDSNTGANSSLLVVSESFRCSLCSAEFAGKSEFIAHMSRHIADSN